jgi:uncharacterized membrane protein
MRRARLGTVLRIALTPLVVWGLYLVRANVWFRLYPAIMSGLALSVFAVSLFRTPLVESIARRMGETLDERGVAYCRKVTLVWTVFLSVHLLVTIATVFASREIWAAYNGLVAYVLMGLLFAGEWFYRRRLLNG